MILKQWGNNTRSFVSEERGENREFLTYAIPEENAAWLRKCHRVLIEGGIHPLSINGLLGRALGPI